MKRKLLISAFAAAVLALLAPSCIRTLEDDLHGSGLPEGTPITMRLDFGVEDLISLDVSTKAEASPADEERIHDLYVLIFCDGEGAQHVNRGQKIYGRYFSYEHLQSTLEELNDSPNEGWWVENRTLGNASSPVAKTRGVVKISTKVCNSAKLVVIANVDNGVCKLGDKEDVLSYLNGIQTYNQLLETQVKLTQDVVNRKDLFLMLGTPEDESGDPKDIDTGSMQWGTLSPSKTYYDEYKINLRAVDAKVKFKVRINDPENAVPYISAAKAVYWEVDNVPDRCYLFSDSHGGAAPEETVYFDTEPAYFEGTDGEWYIFSFYMLESRFPAKASAGDNYFNREKQAKITTDRTGYGGDENEHYVENGEWVYAMPDAAYVKFDMILTLTPEGVQALGGNVNHALTSDTIYTIHLGDFSNAGNNDYNTLRNTCYTYEITIANSGSIYAEVKLDNERQPGQEGYLLLTDDEIVNADCHYEYHSITFYYDPETSPEKFSWYVKTPFTSSVGGGPQKGTKTIDDVDYPVYDPHDMDGTLLDYRWVKFSVNEPDDGKGYSTKRMAYPGDNEYDKDWGVGEHGPWDGTPHPELMDISQLIQYIFEQTDKERTTGSSDFKTDSSIGEKVIRATIFIDEYYYEFDPRDESENPQPDPNLWRQFANAQPREMHILSKTVQSRDRKSDVIESSHSVIQQSIQTIYNIYEPSLQSLWGCEHLDEIKYTTVDGQLESDPAGDWPYWPAGLSESARYGADNEIGRENGRLNSAYIWGVYSRNDNNGTLASPRLKWNNYLDYNVDNRVPELRDDDISDEYGATHHYHGMAWSCLTRNRDNNGNGDIDPEEVRWYMASSQQLAGIWVGTESLSTTARLYQPAAGQWRAHVVSSTNKLVSWSEEGGGATPIETDWANGGGAPQYTGWANATIAAKGESVRCIRNIGTFDDGGTVRDISYAPVTKLPDKYFTLERSDGGEINSFNIKTNPGDVDVYFTFYFDRLNTKSIREFSPGELPYHDQNSLNNRVYVKMITQPLSLDVPAYNEQLGEINNKVTQAGHNDYCPEGYRFPNHTEWLLMSLYLPENYLKKGADGNGYSGINPSRTYYDRGYYGTLRTDDPLVGWYNERNKVGWIFSDKMHCSPYTQTVNHSRCVKDEDQTGVISGKIDVENDAIYPGDRLPVVFKFSSTASTFTNATLTLWYTKNGFRTPYDLTPQLKTPTGLQYKGTQYITIPSMQELGLTSSADMESLNGDGIAMSLEVEFSNRSNQTGGDEIAIRMKNPLSASINTGGYFYPNDVRGGSVAYVFSTASHTVDLASATVKLTYRDQSDNLVERTLFSLDEIGRKSCSGTYDVSVPTLVELGLDSFSANLNRAMTIEATLTSTDGLVNVQTSSVTLVSHLAGSSIQFPTDYDDVNGIPVDVVIESVNDHATVSSGAFYWKKSGSTYQRVEITDGLNTSDVSIRTFVKDIIGEDLSESNKGKYYFYLTAACSDGTSIQSDVWSMDVLYYGKCWNPGPWSASNTVSQINQTWPVESVSDLDFADGDFFDAYMDVSNCVYIRKDGTSNNDIGMDNLISFGDKNSTLQWTTKSGNIIFYYPAHNPPEASTPPDQDKLQIGILHYNPDATIARLRPYTLDDHVLTVRLEKDLLLVNGAEPDWSQDYTAADGKPANQIAGVNTVSRSRAAVSHLTDGNSIKIGSVEGRHRSRATYKYVRVIRKESAEP